MRLPNRFQFKEKKMPKIYRSFMGLLSLLFVAAWSVLISGCQSTPQDIEALAREQLGVSILSVNLTGVTNVPRNSQSGVPWRTRYTRIFTWMSDTGTFPDVVVLQDVTGFMQCALDPTVRDFEAVNFLLSGISAAAGEQYRIAYLVVGQPGGAPPTDWTGNIPSGGCSQTNGKALLYRPSRLRNVITGPGAGESVVSPYDSPFPLLTTYLAMSAQCCPLNPDLSDVCPVTAFMDGSMATPPVSPVFRDGCPTRQGVAYTRSRLATQGVDRTKPYADAVFSRFELVNQPGNFVHVYNVHRGWNDDWHAANGPVPAPQVLDFGSQNINQLVSDMELRFRTSGQETLYPPILVGDFNIGAPIEGELFPPMTTYFPRFEPGVFFEIDGVMFGKRSDFPSKQAAFANLAERMPVLLEGETCETVPAKLWSDHCGIFFRVEPSQR
jgi:hypothetical protein